MKRSFIIVITLLTLIGFSMPLLAWEEANITPWSGWWWPMENSPGKNLYGFNGPMAKYDQLMGKSGSDPDSANSWELNNHKSGVVDWNGHCHAWSAASILEDEPEYGIDTGGIIFKVGDLKGLLTECYFSPIDNGEDYGDRYGDGIGSEDINDIFPKEIIEEVLPQIGVKKLVIVEDKNPYDPVYNHPVYKYELTLTDLNDGNNTFSGILDMVLVDDAVPLDFTGVQTILMKYTFNIRMLNGQFLDDGMWTGDSVADHPDFAWVPTGRGTGGNPYVDYDKVKQLINASSYVKNIIVSQGSNTYQAHWEWNVSQQQRELKIDKNDIFNSSPLNFEIAFGKSMDTSFSGFKVELLNPNTSSWVPLPSGSWDTTGTFPDDKWTGSFTIPANENWSGDVKIKVTAKGMDGQALDSNPISLAPDAGSDILHPRVRDLIPLRVAVDKLTFARKCQPKLTFSYLFGKEQPLV